MASHLIRDWGAIAFRDCLAYPLGMENVPEKIGRYTILETIGRGAMGVVYKARDPLIGRTLAIKTITLSGLLSEGQLGEFKARFFREAQAAGLLHHANIVTIHDVGVENDVPFMAMEFVEGTSLAKRLKEEGRLGAEEAVHVIRQVAEGLAYAHERGIVHRDIKPDNILIENGTGRAVIADFGVAHVTTSELTRTGEILGTPFFMSPEQVLGDPLDGRSDLFSLGVVFYLMLVGRRPFKGDTISSVCYHIVHGQAEPLPHDPAIPAALASVIETMLCKEPAGRYPDGHALVRALDDAFSQTRAAAALSEATLDLAPAPQAGPSATGASTFPAARPRATFAGAPTAIQQTVVQPPDVPSVEESSKKGLLVAALLVLGVAAIAVAFILGVILAAGSGKKPQPPAVTSSDLSLRKPVQPVPPRLEPAQAGQKTEVRSEQQKNEAAKKCSVTVIFETRLPDGRLALFVDGQQKLDLPFLARRMVDGRLGFREAKTFEVPAGKHEVRAVVRALLRRRSIEAQDSKQIVFQAGQSTVIGIEARAFPEAEVVINAQGGQG